jgi:hypothetical protein
MLQHQPDSVCAGASVSGVLWMMQQRPRLIQRLG